MSNKKEDNFVDGIRIKDVIQKVQQELMESQKEREEQGNPSLFQVESLELEINFVVGKEKNNKLDFNLKVIDIGFDKSYNNEYIQKIKLTLKVAERNTRRNIFHERNEDNPRSRSEYPGEFPKTAPNPQERIRQDYRENRNAMQQKTKECLESFFGNNE